jgi:hypothetical protein
MAHRSSASNTKQSKDVSASSKRKRHKCEGTLETVQRSGIEEDEDDGHVIHYDPGKTTVVIR